MRHCGQCNDEVQCGEAAEHSKNITHTDTQTYEPGQVSLLHVTLTGDGLIYRIRLHALVVHAMVPPVCHHGWRRFIKMSHNWWRRTQGFVCHAACATVGPYDGIDGTERPLVCRRPLWAVFAGDKQTMSVE